MTFARPKIMAATPGSFGAFTVAERLPKIVADVVAELPVEAARAPEWDRLVTAVTQGCDIDTSLLAPTTGYLDEIIAGLSGKNWRELPFFDLEFLFYHAINTIAGRLTPGRDVFTKQKQKGLERAIQSVDLPEGPLSIGSAINASLFGNTADLSQLDGKDRKKTSTLIIDERAALADRLSRPGSAPIHLVADNAGTELVADLLLVAALLHIGWSVQLHVKPWPMFVSDATIADVEVTLLAFAASRNETLRQVSAFIRQSKDQGRLGIEAPADWGEPRHLDGLSQPLLDRLCESCGVLLKGDLNYRRAFGDLAWPACTDAATAFLMPSMPAFALRVLKSELAIGTPRDQLARLERDPVDWRTSGLFAVAQFLGRAWPL